MSKVFEDLDKPGIAAAELSPLFPFSQTPNSSPASELHSKKKPGRPKKTDKDEQLVATKVTYVTDRVKSVLKQIQAFKELESGVRPTESNLIEAALILYSKNNKLNIK